MRILLSFLLLSVLGGCSGPAPSGATPTSAPRVLPAAPVTGKVIPGKGMEGLELGQSEADVSKALGPPEEADKNDFNPKQTYALYYSKGLELAFDEGRLSMIVGHAPDGAKWKCYAGGTADGLWVGSTADEIKARLGTPKEEPGQSLKYSDRGIWFRFNDAHQVDSVSVMSATP